MKTTNKILIMSAVALAMAAVPNVKADGALLSPRAQCNQVVSVVNTSSTVAPNTIMPNPSAMLSPRAMGNQITKVAGTNNDPNLVKSDYYTVPGTPRTQQPAPVYQIAPIK